MTEGPIVPLLSAILGSAIGAAATLYIGGHSIDASVIQFRDQQRLQFLREAYDRLSDGMDREFVDGTLPITKEEIFERSRSISRANRLILIYGDEPERNLLISMYCSVGDGYFPIQTCADARKLYPSAVDGNYQEMFTLIVNSARKIAGLPPVSADIANGIVDKRAYKEPFDKAPSFKDLAGDLGDGELGGYVAPIIETPPIGPSLNATITP